MFGIFNTNKTELQIQIQIYDEMSMMPPFRLHWVVCGTFHPLSSRASDSLQDVKQVDRRDHDEGAADAHHDGCDDHDGGHGVGG